MFFLVPLLLFLSVSALAACHLHSSSMSCFLLPILLHSCNLHSSFVSSFLFPACLLLHFHSCNLGLTTCVLLASLSGICFSCLLLLVLALVACFFFFNHLVLLLLLFLRLLLAFVSALAACNLFSGVLPLMSAGVGGLSLGYITWIVLVFNPNFARCRKRTFLFAVPCCPRRIGDLR